MSVERVMYEEATNEYEELKRFERGSEQHVKTTEAANSIMDRINKSEEIKLKHRELDVKERELDIEEGKAKHSKLFDKVKLGVDVGLGVLAVAVTIWQVKDSQNFELGGGTHTTEAGRGGERKLLSLMDRFKKR